MISRDQLEDQLIDIEHMLGQIGEALEQLRKVATRQEQHQPIAPLRHTPYKYASASPMPRARDTVVGFLAKHDPRVLELMGDEAEHTQRDGYWLMHRARERGIKTLAVQAPPILLEQGIRTVKAWPVALLAERFRVTL